MNDQNAKQEPWSATLPNDQSYYWHWNGDEDCAPGVLFVMFSGTANKYFVCHNFMTGAPFVEDVGGLWYAIEPPAITPASTPADAPTTNASIPLADATGEAGEGPTPLVDEAEKSGYFDNPTDAKRFARFMERTIATLTAERDEALAECVDLEAKALTDVKALRDECDRLAAFVRDAANNWDCDTGPNGAHSDDCRTCRAETILERHALPAARSAGRGQA